ncbi:hypothetical protein DENIS_1231 [Desulfonema ishimotonii]|uniref:Carboxypeptidase regulatory-like domain-containing protein n=1 Tax=Desulfonema ishimotonii TaxID=45657 RepID=A0A401FTK0_9BACT|nr:hypothetical protein DENIS_1231 [Desulfonema ishimotonii]
MFGAMRSYATYRGEAFNGLLELGGLVVIFAMVVIGGFKLVPNAKSFNLSVYVHGPGGRQDMVLKNQGEVILDLADNRRSEAINEKGAAYFSGIPAEFFNCEVPVMIQASGFESAETDKKAVLKSGGVYLQVRRDDSLAKITGTVKSADGDFLKGVSIRIGKLKTRTDEGGYFELKIPPENQKARQKLIALLEGYETWEGNVHPGTRQDVGIVLSEKTPKQV